MSAAKDVADKVDNGNFIQNAVAAIKDVLPSSDDVQQDVRNAGEKASNLFNGDNTSINGVANDAKQLLKEGKETVRNVSDNSDTPKNFSQAVEKASESLRAGDSTPNRGFAAVADSVREKASNMEKGEGIKGLADGPKAALQEAGEKAAKEGKTVFGL